MTKVPRSFLALFSALVLLNVKSGGQIGVVPNGDTQVQATADPTYRVGDIWEYETRGGGERSKFVVVKVERSPKVGLIAHIGVDNLTWKSCAGEDVPQYVPHMPFSRKAIDASAVRRIATNRELPEYKEGYEEWRQVFVKGHAGIYTIRIKDAVAVAEETWRTGTAWINPLSPRRYASQTSRWKANEVHPRLLNQESTAWIGLDRRVREGFRLVAFLGTRYLLIVSRRTRYPCTDYEVKKCNSMREKPRCQRLSVAFHPEQLPS